MKKRNKVVAVDFDNTISNYEGWRGSRVYGNPINGVKDELDKFRAAGWKIVIFTCRKNEDESLKEYLEREKIPFDYINRIPGQGEGKVLADVYIDDRAIGFCGKWNGMLNKAEKKVKEMDEEKTKTSFTKEEAKKIGDKIGIDWGKFDLEQFRMGLGVEMEHGAHDKQTNVTDDDSEKTGKIALAHLKEGGDYYTRLKEMEEKMDKDKKDIKKSDMIELLQQSCDTLMELSKAMKSGGGKKPTKYITKKPKAGGGWVYEYEHELTGGRHGVDVDEWGMSRLGGKQKEEHEEDLFGLKLLLDGYKNRISEADRKIKEGVSGLYLVIMQSEKQLYEKLVEDVKRKIDQHRTAVDVLEGHEEKTEKDYKADSAKEKTGSLNDMLREELSGKVFSPAEGMNKIKEIVQSKGYEWPKELSSGTFLDAHESGFYHAKLDGTRWLVINEKGVGVDKREFDVTIRTNAEEKKDRKKASNDIQDVLRGKYFETQGEGWRAVEEVMNRNNFGFNNSDYPTLQHVNYGSSVHYHEQVGGNSYLSMMVYRMPSGRYEVTAYLS